MSDRRPITFAVAVNNRELFENNFLASPCVNLPPKPQILVQEGFRSLSAAYNDALDRSTNDLVVFCHQDVLLGSSWRDDLERTLEGLESGDPRWGVLGSCGATADGRRGRILGQVYSPGRGIIGEPLQHPAPVQTLDGLLLILRKSSGLRFDERLPHFHFYGADVCLTAAKRRMRSYAIPPICIHNTQRYAIYPPEFYECYRYIRRVWKDELPLQTTCLRFTRFNLPMHRMRIRERLLRFFGHKGRGATRSTAGRELLNELENGAPRQGAGSSADSTTGVQSGDSNPAVAYLP